MTHKVELEHNFTGSSERTLEMLLKDFNDHHNECPVVAVHGTETAGNNLTLVLDPMTNQSKLIAGAENRLPLTELLGREESQSIASIVKTSFGNMRLPLKLDCLVLYINKEALSGIGYSRDWVPQTLDDLNAAAKLMVMKGVVDIGWTYDCPESALVEAFFAQQDKPLIKPDNGAKGYGTYDTVQLTDLLFNFWRQRNEKSFIAHSEYDFFAEGRCGFLIRTSSSYGAYAQAAEFHMGASELPILCMSYDGLKHALPFIGESLIAVKPSIETKNEPPEPGYAPPLDALKTMIDSTKDFVDFWVSSEAQELWHKQTGSIPLNWQVPDQLELNGYYVTRPAQKSAIDQTIRAVAGKTPSRIEMPNYEQAQKALLVLLRHLLTLDMPEERVPTTIRNSLSAFDRNWSIPKPAT